MSEEDEDRKKGSGWLAGGATLVAGLIIAFGALSNSDDGINFPAGNDTISAAAGAVGDAADDAADAAGDAADDAADAADDAADAANPDVIPETGSDGAELACTLKNDTAQTALTLDPAVATALEGAGVAVAPIAPAAAADSAINFAVKSNRVACDGRSGFIGHRGGLKFTAGAKSVELRRYPVDIASGSVVAFPKSTGTASVEPFTFDFSKSEVPTDEFALNDVPVNLTAVGASALNDGLGVTVFEDGQNIGTVAVTGERS